MKPAKFGISVSAFVVCTCVAGTAFGDASSAAAAAPQATAACTAPTQVSSTPEETAWRLFVAATCAVGSGNAYPYVTWETWIEQDQLYTPSGQLMQLQVGQRPRFHMSPLAKFMQEQKKNNNNNLAFKQKLLLPNQGCNSDTWTKRTICEEARINPDAKKYITDNKLNTLKGQEAFVTNGTPFQFTPPSIEIKADWILLASCSNLPKLVHVEKVTEGGKTSCYALGGIHLISKLIDKWVWATFEPQNAVTNPRRCVVLGCRDPWGSDPATTSGKATQLTPALVALVKQANLAPEWANYRLDGVQTDYLDSQGNATRLGNSIIEGENAGTPADMKISSCISCHVRSAVDKNGNNYSPAFVIGLPGQLPAGFVPRDFVWSLALAQ